MKDSITIFYDDGCRLCHREIAHYKKIDRDRSIEYVDISAPDFDPAAHGLKDRDTHRKLHVRGSDGNLNTGVDAFVTIWEKLPGYRHLVPFAKFPPVRWFMKLGYTPFTYLRPLLPRRKK